MILSAILLSSLSAQAGIMKDLDMICTSERDSRDKLFVSITPINGNKIMSVFTQIDGKDCNGNSIQLDEPTYTAFTENENSAVNYTLDCHALEVKGLDVKLISTEVGSVWLQADESSATPYECERKGYFERLKESLTLNIGS